METYEAKKHWWFWVPPVTNSLIFLITLILPIWVMLWAILRWNLDKIEIKDGCLYSRMGIIFIDKKTIPLEQISMVSEKTDIIAQWLGFGTIEVQSSAFGKTISYPWINNPAEFIKRVNDYKKSN